MYLSREAFLEHVQKLLNGETNQPGAVSFDRGDCNPIYTMIVFPVEGEYPISQRKFRDVEMVISTTQLHRTFKDVGVVRTHLEGESDATQLYSTLSLEWYTMLLIQKHASLPYWSFVDCVGYLVWAGTTVEPRKLWQEARSDYRHVMRSIDDDYRRYAN